jgi:chromosome segregation ATPase
VLKADLSAAREADTEARARAERLEADLNRSQVEAANRAGEAATLRDELAAMHERETALAEACERLRVWLSVEAYALETPSGETTPAGRSIADIQAGAEHLRAESQAHLRRALLAEHDRDEAEAALAESRERVKALTSELGSAIGERDAAQSRLEEHEARLREAGIEIEWAPKRKHRSR